jgi:hypothetical protein
MVAEFKKSVRTKEANRFGNFFSDMVDQWLHNPSGIPSLGGQRDPTINYATYPSQYINILNRANTNTNANRLDELTKGFLATTWHELASTYFSNPEDPITQRDDGSHRIANAIRALQKFTHSIWLGRNDALHRQNEIHTRHQRTAIDAEIARHHANSSSLPAADRHYCKIRLESLLCRSPSYKRRWIYRIRRAKILFHQTRENHQTRLPQYFKRSKTSSISPRTTNDAHNTGNSTQASFNGKRTPRTQTHRNKSKRPINTTQQLISKFLRKRASNRQNLNSTPSPPPT